MSKQTAFKWLLEQWPILQSQLPPSIINETLQMEQEQIQDAYVTGAYLGYGDSKTYYNETYGGNNE
jgi:hypothetical protein